MVKRFLKIKSYVDVAISNLYHDKVEFKEMRPGPTLYAAEEVAFKKLLEVLVDIETETHDLGAENTLKMHRVDVVTAGLLKRLNSFINSTPPGTVGHELSNICLSDVGRRQLKRIRFYRMPLLFIQVGAMLTSSYKRMQFMADLDLLLWT